MEKINKIIITYFDTTVVKKFIRNGVDQFDF